MISPEFCLIQFPFIVDFVLGHNWRQGETRAMPRVAEKAFRPPAGFGVCGSVVELFRPLLMHWRGKKVCFQDGASILVVFCKRVTVRLPGPRPVTGCLHTLRLMLVLPSKYLLCSSHTSLHCCCCRVYCLSSLLSHSNIPVAAMAVARRSAFPELVLMIPQKRKPTFLDWWTDKRKCATVPVYHLVAYLRMQAALHLPSFPSHLSLIRATGFKASQTERESEKHSLCGPSFLFLRCVGQKV